MVRQGTIVGEGYEEIASVPLPGAPRISSGPELEGETFGGTKRRYLRKLSPTAHGGWIYTALS